MESPSLAKLAQELIVNGPHKLERTNRRVRALYDNTYIFDTTEYVFPNYPLLDLMFEIYFGVSAGFILCILILGLTARL